MDAIERNDRENVEEYLDALREWNRKGVALPTVKRINTGDNSPYAVFRKCQ